MNKKSIFALLIILSLLSACAQATPTISYPPPVTQPETPTTGYPPPGTVSTPGPYPGPTTPAGQTPAQLAAIQEVSKKYNIPAEQIQIISTEPMTWPTGCLGVVIPGVLCADIVVNGFIVKLEANGQQFEMHTNQDGTSVVDAAEQLATLNFAVRTPAQAIVAITPNFPLGPTYNPAFNGLLPLGGAISGTAYVIDTNQGKVVAVDINGGHDLTFIQKPTYGLAVWRGGLGTQPLLAWGTQPATTDGSTSLMVASPDGSNLQTLLTISPQTTSIVALVAEAWSVDGKSLYFSKEPTGIGGYILFGGASNLYKIDITTKEVTEIIPQAPSTGLQICLDAISGDYRYIADHCTKGVITIRDLQAGSSATLQPPSDFTSYQVVGSARFSPAGDRVAFALAKNDPNAEQGWVAVGSRSGGNAALILTSEPGNYYTVLGWLDDQTILVQSNTVGSPNGVNQVLTVSADGSTVTTLYEGIFLTVIDNR